jgi:hypothetical protein
LKLELRYKEFDKTFEYQYCVYSYPFRIFYNINNDGKTPKILKYSQHEKIPDYIIEIFKSFYKAFDIFIKVCRFKNPLKEGIYFEKGASFIDVLISDIPVQRGLVAASLIDNSKYFKDDDSLKGKSIRILLHNDLVKNTATPIHELFHVFQYNYCNFNNMWFMEGLARWSQNLIQKRKMQDEILPQNLDELKDLLKRAHDCEYFWRRLTSLLVINEPFIKQFLENLSKKSEKLENQFNYKKNNWTKEEKRLDKNNPYILKVLIDTINLIPRNPNKELDGFIQTVCDYISYGNKRFNNPSLQSFFKVLKKCDSNLVKKEENYLYSEYFDLRNRNLKVEKLNCTNLSEYELDILNQVVSIEGELFISIENIEFINAFNYLQSVEKLTIQKMTNLQAINGFNGLRQIKSLEISYNDKLTSINGFNNLFKFNNEVLGYIKVINNKNLEEVKFLKGLKIVNSSFYLHHNRLKTLEGLENLENVYASFSLSSNEIQSLKPLSNLKKVSGMLGLAFNNLETLEGLENLSFLKTIAWNGQNRTIVIHGNKNLKDISALKNITTQEKYLIIFIDDYKQYETKPSSDSVFHQNILELYDTENKKFIPTYWFVKKEKHDYSEFGKATHNEKLKYLLDFELESEILVISFSGYYGHLGGIFNSRYPFLTNELKTNKIFILDEYNSWYHNGIKNITSNIDETIKFLKQLISNGNYKKIVCFGSSMGGYISLAIAQAIGATNVIAFSPQTFLDDVNRKKYGDKRWKEPLALLNRNNEKYLDLKPLYENFKGGINIEIHYSINEKLDELHAKHLDNKNIKVIAHDDSDHYLAVYLHKKGLLEDIVLNNLQISKNSKKLNYQIIFGDNWSKATSKCSFLKAHHLSFKDINSVIEYGDKNGIKTLFANNYKTQMAIVKNQELLDKWGFKYIVNSQKVLKRFVDKQLFYEIMKDNAYEDYVPKYYENIEEVVYPCIVKTKSGGAGRGIFLAYNKDDLKDLEENEIVSEYLSSNKEYATSIFMKDGKILKDITFCKTASKELYVLQHESKNSIETKYCETPFLELFEEILQKFVDDDKYCQCSINFKIQDGIPKIFEINPRIGYTLAGFCDKFKEMMDIYLDELEI